MAESTLLILGASRGLGLALAEEHLKRGWRVIGTIRGRAWTGLHDLAEQYDGRLEIETLDITSSVDLKALAHRLAGRRIDLLFVNAGIANGPAETVGEVSTDCFIRLMLTNTLAPMRAIETLEHLVPPGGTIGIMSSGLGSVADNETGGWEVYRASKAALNQLMRSFAARHAGDPRAMVIIAPGWVRTDMGGAEATLGIEDSIPRVADVLARRAGKPGLVYLNYKGETVRW